MGYKLFPPRYDFYLSCILSINRNFFTDWPFTYINNICKDYVFICAVCIYPPVDLQIIHIF